MMDSFSRASVHRTREIFAVCLAIFGLMACDNKADSTVDLELSTLKQAASQPGRWMIPASDLEEGNRATVPVTEAGPWNDGANCSPWFTEGAKQLKQWVLDNWPGVTNVGGYNCRPIAGTSSTSIHGVGRALDIHFAEDMGQADNDLGDALANYLVRHAEFIGVQRVIWDQSIWTAGRGMQAREYGGVSPHTDHIHMELSVPAGNLETEFFQMGLPSPDRAPCAMPIPAQGTTIDNTDICFQAFGKSEYWRPVEGAGIGGGLIWTNAFNNDSPSNWARWSFTVSMAGEYEIEVHTARDYSKYDGVRYEVQTPRGALDIIADLKDYDGWYSLGTFEFDTAREYSVSVFDNYEGTVGDDLHITADAIRLILHNATPNEPDPTPQSPPAGGSPSPAETPTPPNEPVVEDPSMEEPVFDPGPDVGMGAGDSNDDRPEQNDLDETDTPPSKRISRVYYEAGCTTQDGGINGLFALILLALGFRLKRRFLKGIKL